MAQRLSQPDSLNVLISNPDWAWPQAVSEIFEPRQINALIAHTLNDMLNLVSHHRMHLAILDTRSDEISGTGALKIIRQHDRLLPCILLAAEPSRRLLAEALSLNVFSVLAKPVNLRSLATQIDRLFLKYYDINGN